MAKRVSRYGVDSATMQNLIGEARELIINVSTQTIHLHDGVAPGGIALARADLNNVADASSSAAGKMSAAQAVALTVATADIDTLETGLAQEIADRIADVDALDAALTATFNAALATKMALDTDAVTGNLPKFAAGGEVEDSGFALANSLFPAGTKCTFNQTTAPLGWTKLTTANDAALRVVSGTVGSGGVDNFTTVFGTGKVTDGHVLTVAQMPAHTHLQRYKLRSRGSDTNNVADVSTGVTDTSGDPTASTGSGNSHTHGISNLNLKYVDVIIAQRDALP